MAGRRLGPAAPRRRTGSSAPTKENLNQEYGRIANENYSAYGPVGIVAFLAAIALTIWDFARRRVGARHLVLACALPVFLVVRRALDRTGCRS